MAVQIYSGNSDEVTGATLNGGETGGTWTEAGELLGVTGGPDGGLAVFVTEMSTAGTIWGGSVNPNPTMPVNSVSLTFGFFLRIPPPKIEFLKVRFAPLTGLLTGLDASLRDAGPLFHPFPRGLEA